MIFLTVGSQMPFDRMVKVVNEWASLNPDVEVVAQIGDSIESFDCLSTFSSLSPQEYDQYVLSADLVIGHAGMGTVITCREFCKPLAVMARRGDFLETRNEHQVATTKWICEWRCVEEFNNVEELAASIAKLLENCSEMELGAAAESELVSNIRTIIREI